VVPLKRGKTIPAIDVNAQSPLPTAFGANGPHDALPIADAMKHGWSRTLSVFATHFIARSLE
jgi:hypothetical protein